MIPSGARGCLLHYGSKIELKYALCGRVFESENAADIFSNRNVLACLGIRPTPCVRSLAGDTIDRRHG